MEEQILEVVRKHQPVTTRHLFAHLMLIDEPFNIIEAIGIVASMKADKKIAESEDGKWRIA